MASKGEVASSTTPRAVGSPRLLMSQAFTDLAQLVPVGARTVIVHGVASSTRRDVAALLPEASIHDLSDVSDISGSVQPHPSQPGSGPSHPSQPGSGAAGSAPPGFGPSHPSQPGSGAAGSAPPGFGPSHPSQPGSGAAGSAPPGFGPVPPPASQPGSGAAGSAPPVATRLRRGWFGPTRLRPVPPVATRLRRGWFGPTQPGFGPSHPSQPGCSPRARFDNGTRLRRPTASQPGFGPVPASAPTRRNPAPARLVRPHPASARPTRHPASAPNPSQPPARLVRPHPASVRFEPHPPPPQPGSGPFGPHPSQPGSYAGSPPRFPTRRNPAPARLVRPHPASARPTRRNPAPARLVRPQRYYRSRLAFGPTRLRPPTPGRCAPTWW